MKYLARFPEKLTLNLSLLQPLVDITAEEIVKLFEQDERARKRLAELMVTEPDVRLAIINAVIRDVATKRDLEELRRELKEGIDRTGDKLKTEMEKMKEELEGEIDEMRNDLKAYIDSMRDELKADIENVRNELRGEIERGEGKSLKMR